MADSVENKDSNQGKCPTESMFLNPALFSFLNFNLCKHTVTKWSGKFHGYWMIWTTLLFGGISQMSTHPEETNQGEYGQHTRGHWRSVGGGGHSPLPPHRGIRRILSNDPFTPFDIDGKMPISLGLTCSSKRKILKMPLNAGRCGVGSREGSWLLEFRN